MGRQRPASATNAVRAQAALVLVGAMITVLTVLQRDELTRLWNAGQPVGTQPPAFVPVAVVLFFTFALLAGILVVFFRDGHPSARHALTGLAVFHLFCMLILWLQGPPVLFVVLAAASGLLDLALVFFLWHRDTTAFLRGAELVSRQS